MDNARGDVPREWYRDEGHVGYDVDGRKIVKQKWDDSIEHLIRLTDDLSYWRNVFDEKGEKELVVSKSQLELFRRLRTSIIPVKDIHSDEVRLEIGSSDHFQTIQVPKRRFIPSKWEAKLVLRIMRGLRRKASIQLLENSPADNQKLIWIEEENRTSERNDGRACLPAPKVKLPTNIDSYNPPPEYDCAEVVKSIGHSVVQKIDLGSQVALRAVPSYSDFVTERFQRCLDLYLCPRVLRTRLNFQQSDILPSLPTTKELKPFPSLQSLPFFGHSTKSSRLLYTFLGNG